MYPNGDEGFEIWRESRLGRKVMIGWVGMNGWIEAVRQKKKVLDVGFKAK